jgi:hypothetical protein
MGQPDQNKAKVHASQTKLMLLAFFSSTGLIYLHIIPRDSTVNVAYIVKAVGIFIEHLKKKRPILVEQI